MNQIFEYSQIKKRQENISECQIAVFFDNEVIYFRSKYYFKYIRFNHLRSDVYYYSFSLNITSGDLFINIITEKTNHSKKKLSTSTKTKLNDFNLFYTLSNFGVKFGCRKSFWGVKYIKATDKIVSSIREILNPNYTTEYFRNLELNTHVKINPIYDLCVGYHIDKKGIRGHNHIFWDIRKFYPKPKWLRLNKYKFLPAVLDSFGVKSKYLVKKLNIVKDNQHHLSSVVFLCKLFGDTYLNYLKKIEWIEHCKYDISTTKFYEFKTENEKRLFVDILNSWYQEEDFMCPIIIYIRDMLRNRDFIESFGVKLKFNPHNITEFKVLYEKWNLQRDELKRGYKFKYIFPPHFISSIEKNIILDGKIFFPYILKSKEDFNIEGVVMKNCMATHFLYGNSYIYISLRDEKTSINLQYKDGNLAQHYGKGNSSTMDYFFPVIQVLNQRMKEHTGVNWTKEKVKK
jgi:hypothetical protein